MVPDVSVIIPVYNGEAFIARALDSVLAQSGVDLEILVVDDGSSDRTSEVLSKYRAEARVLRQPNRGVYAARNAALREAQGRFIAFLDADDEWLPEKLRRQMAVFLARPETDLVFGDGEIVDASGRVVSHMFAREPPARGLAFEELVQRNFIPQSAVLVRRECFERHGFFREVPLGADYHKWLQIAQQGRIDFVPEVVFRYHEHGGNISRNRIARYTCVVDHLEDLAQRSSPDDAQILRRRRMEFEWLLALAHLRSALSVVRGSHAARTTSGSWSRRVGALGRVAAHGLRLVMRRRHQL